MANWLTFKNGVVINLDQVVCIKRNARTLGGRVIFAAPGNGGPFDEELDKESLEELLEAIGELPN